MWNTRNLDVIDEVCAPSPDGHDGIKQVVGSYVAAFPDGRHIIHYQVAEGDTVVTPSHAPVHLTAHRCPYPGGTISPPTRCP